jgi:hypothetical protein
MRQVRLAIGCVRAGCTLGSLKLYEHMMAEGTTAMGNMGACITHEVWRPVLVISGKIVLSIEQK